MTYRRSGSYAYKLKGHQRGIKGTKRFSLFTGLSSGIHEYVGVYDTRKEAEEMGVAMNDQK